MFFKKGAVILILLSGVICGRGEEKKPCLIFQREGKENYAVDLDRYNRIKFGSESMLLSSSENTGNTLEILYSAYNQFKIGESIPSTSAVEEIIENDVSLIYSPTEQKLILSGDSEESYDIGVFNLNGILELNTRLNGGEALSFQSLGSGMYVVVVVSETKKLTIKVVK